MKNPFCNNKNCTTSNTCFRFLPENSGASDLKYGVKKCKNYVIWTYPKEVDEKRKDVEKKANEFYLTNKEKIDKESSEAEFGSPPSFKDFSNVKKWTPENWFWFLTEKEAV